MAFWLPAGHDWGLCTVSTGRCAAAVLESAVEPKRALRWSLQPLFSSLCLLDPRLLLKLSRPQQSHLYTALLMMGFGSA